MPTDTHWVVSTITNNLSCNSYAICIAYAQLFSLHNRSLEHDPLRAHVGRLIVYEGDMHNPFIGPNASPRN